MMPHAQQHTRQLSLWERIGRKARPKQPPRPKRPIAPIVTPVLEIPLTEKTLATAREPGALVRVLGSDAKSQRYHVVGVMLCGDVCRVLLRKEGVTDGPMAQAVVEALTLA